VFWDIIFWAILVAAVLIGAAFFRDLGDVSQMLIKVKRDDMLRAIRNEPKTLKRGLGLGLGLVIVHLLFGGGSTWAFWVGLGLVTLLFGFPFVWLHIGLRNQQGTARYYSITEAQKHINPAASVLVIESNGHARAHSDYDLARPHLASSPDGLDGENIIMAYCSMANLGMGYKAEIDGRRLDIDVLAQHGNNLLLRDKATNEPIQHIYGQRICDLAPATDGASHCDLTAGRTGMPQWPTFRMSFRAFQKAYPEGEVFLNKLPGNPFLWLLDFIVDALLVVEISRQHREEKPIMDNMTHYDDRLPNKTYVWGIEINGDSVAYTEDFIFQHDSVVNATIGGRAIVVAYDSKMESLGSWHNDSGVPVGQVDFWGHSDQGQLERVESMRPGMFWHVWAEYFRNTAINRMDGGNQDDDS